MALTLGLSGGPWSNAQDAASRVSAYTTAGTQESPAFAGFAAGRGKALFNSKETPMDQQTKQWIVDRVMWIMGLVAAVLVATQALAAEDKRVLPTDDPWKSECGSCQVACPPRLLPPSSWRGIMEGLDEHFGVDAGVGAEAAHGIGTFLQENAGRDRGAPDIAPTLRITETAGFRQSTTSTPTLRRPCRAIRTSGAQPTSEHATAAPRAAVSANTRSAFLARSLYHDKD